MLDTSRERDYTLSRLLESGLIRENEYGPFDHNAKKKGATIKAEVIVPEGLKIPAGTYWTHDDTPYIWYKDPKTGKEEKIFDADAVVREESKGGKGSWAEQNM